MLESLPHDLPIDHDGEAVSAPVCPACASPDSESMGALGRIIWSRCRACGVNFPEESGGVDVAET